MKTSMGRRGIAALLLCASFVGMLPITAGAAANNFSGEEWYSQIDTVEVNREPAHASFIPYETPEKALNNEKSVLDDADEKDSGYYQSLNGTWSFYQSKNPDGRLKNQYGASAAGYVENWNTSGWDTIQVPSNTQTQKNPDGSFKYDTPIYTNQTYPWANYESVNYNNGKPVAPTVVNSVSHYKRTFTVPADWNGRQVFVSFQGVESAFYLYINGKRVGYSEDSYTASDFNITSYLKTGANTIAVEVYRWSTGSYLENQDFIRLSGIFRDVFLYSKDSVALRDIFVTPKLGKSSATLDLSVDVKNYAGASGSYTVSAQLYDADGNKVGSAVNAAASVSSPKSGSALIDDTGVTAKSTLTVTNPHLWFADDPYLYRLVVQLKDSRGKVLENACIRVGIREIGTAAVNSSGQQQIQINGKKIYLRGVNRHESDLENGRALTRQNILDDVLMMKAFNVNAVRTSHYPNNPYLYDLADELGLYICDEANIESHSGSFGDTDIPSGRPIWNTAVMDRTKNMVERDKNHPSVVIWSLGNEATYKDHALDSNYCFYNSTRWILERDPSRVRKYERDNRYTEGSRASSMVDVYSTQYWPYEYAQSHITNKAQKLPYIQSEYAHAMGTGLGNLKEYWDLFRQYENANGGFIWDWMDQSILTTKNGSSFFGYGGDWGERVTDNDFCANGLVNADKTPSPELYEVRKVLQEVTFTDVDAKNGQVKITNEFLATNLNQFDILWTYTEDNREIAGGALTETEKDIAPATSKTVTVRLPETEIVPGRDYVLAFSVRLKQDAPWVSDFGGEAGFEIAFEQFLLRKNATAEQPRLDEDAMGDMTVENGDREVRFQGTTEDGASFDIVISKSTGFITRYRVDGVDLMTKGPQPNYYRAPTSNDIGAGAAGVKDAEKNFTVKSLTVDVDEKAATVAVQGEISNVRSENNLTYTIYANGMVEVTNEFTPSSQCGKLTRVGMRLFLNSSLEQVAYYGRGAQENYADRNTGSKLGVYGTTVTDMFESKRVKPQENGNRTDTRWVALMDNNGQRGLLVSAAETMEFSALHYTAEELASKRHPYELNATADTVLTVDYAQRGLGNASCGADTMGKYQLVTDVAYRHTYTIAPISGKASTDPGFVDDCMDISSRTESAPEPVLEGDYLSDMTWTNSVSGYFANTRDLCGTNLIQLVVDGVPKTFEKGVGMHAPASVTVDISGKGYSRFIATAGINYNQVVSSNGNSNVNLVVLVDGTEKFRQNNVGYNASGNVFTVPVDVNVKDAKTVTIKAEMGANDYNDHVSWGDAIFVKSEKPEIVAARNVSAVTQSGVIPTLPEKVAVASAKGAIQGEYPVKWDTMRGSSFGTVGSIVEVKGTVTAEGKTFPVTASVRVANPTVGSTENQAPEAELSQNIAQGNQSDNLASITNGNKYPGNNAQERWTNYNNRTTSDSAALTFTWDAARTISSADLYYYTDNYAAYLPSAYKFEYLSASGKWTALSAAEKAVADYDLGAQYRYTFNAVETKAIRITLTQQGGTSGGKCVGLTEVEIIGGIRDVQRSANAALSGIFVDGEAIAEFKADTMRYTATGETVTAAGNENVAITILPVCDGVVPILTLAENGSSSRIYQVTLKTTPVCDHHNTVLRDEKEPTCTEPGYTGDLYCADCGQCLRTGAVLPAAEHSYGDWVVTKAPTCTASGLESRACAHCGHTETRTVDAVGHSYGDWVMTKAPTCTEMGNETRTCVHCGNTLTKAIAALGHKWDAGRVTLEPTEHTDGVKTYTCTTCGAVREERIPCTGEKKAPTVKLQITKDADGKMALKGMVDDYENLDSYAPIVAHGLVYYATAKLGTKTLTINTSGRTRVNFSGYREDGSFVYHMQPANGNVKYTVRAFVAYVDENGKTVYVYSAPIAACYNGL